MSSLFGVPKGQMQEAPQCPVCKTGLTPGLPYCPGCGSQLDRTEQSRVCPKCSSAAGPHAKFCPECGYGLDAGARAHRRTSSMYAQTIDTGIVLTRLDETGQELSTHEIVTETTTIGRDGADIDFSEDRYLSPRHAELSLDDGVLSVRDLGSRNGTWFFIEAPYKLTDGDLVLVGSQIFRFRRLGYPGPHPPEADATRRLGSLTPSADIATLAQVRADGSLRDIMHLSPGRNITIGRDQGDWIFSYDPSMSGLHAQIQSDDADFVLIDADSRNGVAVNVRGSITLNQHSRILVGDKMLRVTLP